MAFKVGDKVRLLNEGESMILDGMLNAVPGATELYGRELTVVRTEPGFVGNIGVSEPIEGYEHMGGFVIDSTTARLIDSEEIAA